MKSCWEAATGITMSALIRSSPTVRIDRVTVTEAITTTSRFNSFTRMPSTRAKSSSAQTANSRGNNPSEKTSTATASAAMTQRSDSLTEVRAPNR